MHKTDDGCEGRWMWMWIIGNSCWNERCPVGDWRWLGLLAGGQRESWASATLLVLSTSSSSSSPSSSSSSSSSSSLGQSRAGRIVWPGYSSSGYILGCSQRLASRLRRSDQIGYCCSIFWGLIWPSWGIYEFWCLTARESRRGPPTDPIEDIMICYVS